MFFFKSRASPHRSPSVHSPHDHSAVGHDDDDDVQEKAASPPPAVASPPRRNPTPPAVESPPQQQAPPAPLPPPMPTTTAAASSAPAGAASRRKRSSAETQRSLQPPAAKRKALNTKIPKTTKLPYEKTDEEVLAASKAEVKAFFEKCKANRKAEQEPPYLMYPRSKLRQVVQKMTDANRAASKQPGSTISDYDRTVLKKIKADKRKVQQKVAQLGEQAQQSVQPLVVANEYGSNANLLAMTIPANVDLDELGNWMEETGLPLEALLGRTDAPIHGGVDDYQSRYIYGRSMCHPEKVRGLGTQIYKLHEYYLRVSSKHKEEELIAVRVRDRHYFRGDDVIWIDFSEVHQLLHMNALDKSLMSCYCL